MHFEVGEFLNPMLQVWTNIIFCNCIFVHLTVFSLAKDLHCAMNNMHEDIYDNFPSSRRLISCRFQ